MYGLPPNFDASVFQGLLLESICFTQNTVHFEFDREVTITLESSYLLRLGALGDERNDVPVMESRLMRLVGHTLTQAHVGENARSLKLVFEQAQVLEIFDNSQQYESFRIIIGDREIIV